MQQPVVVPAHANQSTARPAQQHAAQTRPDLRRQPYPLRSPPDSVAADRSSSITQSHREQKIQPFGQFRPAAVPQLPSVVALIPPTSSPPPPRNC